MEKSGCTKEGPTFLLTMNELDSHWLSEYKPENCFEDSYAKRRARASRFKIMSYGSDIMVSNSEQKRIQAMIESLKKHLAGDSTAALGISSQNDALDELAETINTLLKKTKPCLSRESSSGKIEERYRHILDTIEESYFEVDLKGNVLFFNEATLRELSYSPEEISKMSYRQLTDENNARKVNSVFHHVFRTGETVKAFDWEILRKDGKKINVESSVALMHDEHGRPCGFRGVVRDVTQRNLAEKRLRIITENIHDAIWTRDFDLSYTYLSPSIFQLTGYTAEEIMQAPPNSILPYEDHERLQQELTTKLAYARAHPLEKGETFHYEVQTRHKNGSEIWLEISANFNRNENGIPFEIVGITHDITARKKAEAAFAESEKLHRLIVENMQDSITLLDMNLQQLYQSPSEIHITGYTPEEIMKIPIEKQVTPESFERAMKILSEELEKEFNSEPADPHRSIIIEVESYRKDGGTVWLEETVTFNRNEAGKPIGILLSGRNITERKKAEQERDRFAAQLLHAQKMETVGRLAGGVAHDFNNMLSVILGYIDLAKMRLQMDNPIYSDLLEIEKAATRSRDLTAQLLAFSRKQIISPRVIDLNALVAETQKAITRLIGEDIDLKFYPGDDLWAIKFDPVQIEQILINLAVNARDAMPKGGRLLLETSNVAVDAAFCEAHLDITPGQYVLLSVSDTGTGIHKETIPFVFEPFFTTKDVGKGTGLGLATVYGIIKQNDGFINVSSEPGRGSAFKMYLPRTEEIPTMRQKAYEHPASPGSGTILLVEDDEMVLKMVSNMLEALGYMVIATENPQDALSLCEKAAAPIDLVITDVVMPQMSGKELRDKLMMISPDLKILFMSGYTSNIIAQHGVLEEGTQFIQKPFNIHLLAEKVKQMMAEKP